MGLKIGIGITGSIAAYRSPDLVKELVARGHDTRVVLTNGGKEFVSPRVLETFSGSPVLATNPFDSTHFGTDHIALARWADVFIVYGATADFMARYATGLADDFLCLQLVATESPVVLAPAMNPVMWKHASVRANFETLKSRGVRFAGPIAGVVACGEEGVGHIAEIKDIANAIEAAVAPKSFPLQGKTVLISAGPMRTGLDPVRFVQNRSSGKMGLELARTARAMGAKVQVLLGPVDASMAKAYSEFEVERYEGPEQYRGGLEKLFAGSDYFFSASAVLDFELLSKTSKIERSSLPGGELSIAYQAVPDFVAQTASRRRAGQKVIAFAAETGTNDEIVKRATEKMAKKSVDAMIANPVREGVGPEAEQNEIWILKPGKNPLHIGPAPKASLAEPILRAAIEL